MSNGLELAVTTIGDLLMNNKITRNKENKPIEHVELVIPNYQRPYKWTAKNVNQLFDDIVDAKNNNKEAYRVGTLILHYNENNADNKITYDIVDGQQRTTTFALLLEAFRSEKSEEISCGSIKFLEQHLADNEANKRNVPVNYRILKRRINSIGEKADLFNYIKNNCELIVVITGDLSEAFQFFDSQNARGKKLYPHDLLKAYHLREMNNMEPAQIEKVVKLWEDLDQKQLSVLFSDYLYRIKEWTKGNRAWELTEHNIHHFKGVTANDNYPYAMYYKGAYAYADLVNGSSVPFVTGMTHLRAFQLNAPIIAGKPFFDYAKYYFEMLKDIQNNDKYEGYYINDNEIVKTLNLPHYKSGVGNRITRLMFDTAILAYIDRFCPDRPAKADEEMLNHFVKYAFVWAYSMRAQYYNVGWQVAQNYIMGVDKKLKNNFNIYKEIAQADSPLSLLSTLSDKVIPLNGDNKIVKEKIAKLDAEDAVNSESEQAGKNVNKIHKNFLHFFDVYGFLNRNNNSTEDNNEKNTTSYRNVYK